MLLIRNQLEISKKEIIQELLDINKYITNDITIKLSELSKKKKKRINKFSSENNTVHSELQHCKFFSHLLPRITHGV